MDSNEREELCKKGERVRGGNYRSRAHSKNEKRKQRKTWKRRKCEEGEKNEKARGPEIVDVPEGRKKNETTREPDAGEVLEPQTKKKRIESKNPSPVASTLSRGKYLVNLSNLKSKRISQSEEKITPAAKIPRKRMDVCSGETAVKKTEAPAFKEINRALLKADKTQKIGSGTCGN